MKAAVSKFFMSKMFIFFITFSFIQNSYAYFFAKVVADKATIYADKDLKIPIGYIQYGRVVKVGEVLLANKNVISLLLSGKVAYAKVDVFIIAKGRFAKNSSRYKKMFRTQKNVLYIPRPIHF